MIIMMIIKLSLTKTSPIKMEPKGNFGWRFNDDFGISCDTWIYSDQS